MLALLLSVVPALLLGVVPALLLGGVPALLLGVAPAKHYRGPWVTEQMNGHRMKKNKIGTGVQIFSLTE